ncbi:hypothetical protein [Microvirga massiliensis]|uniref:hypothetical protein n=1 Tax=Microvirga massiliensis TaxID=1033741 RepID=UPI0011C9E429|nr:hypothetical protein [Microvirga massiliensis]
MPDLNVHAGTPTGLPHGCAAIPALSLGGIPPTGGRGNSRDSVPSIAFPSRDIDREREGVDKRMRLADEERSNTSIRFG